jgi:hypothetical protein
MLSHCLFDVLVAAVDSIWAEVQVLRVPHALSDVIEGARVSNWVAELHVVNGLHSRSPEACQPDMYWELVSQTVKSAQVRSLNVVGAADSYCSALHSLHAWHTGWAVVDAAVSWNSIKKLQASMASQSLSEFAVGASVSI